MKLDAGEVNFESEEELCPECEKYNMSEDAAVGFKFRNPCHSPLACPYKTKLSTRKQMLAGIKAAWSKING